MINRILIAGIFVGFHLTASAQQVDRNAFFADDHILNATLTLPMQKIIHHGTEGKNTVQAIFSCKLPDSSVVSQRIQVDTRGHMRRSFCYLPPLKLIFNKTDSGRLSPLKSLKLVSVCKVSNDFSQYLLQEYLVYKIYNLLTEKSFRARLLSLNYEDSAGKKKPFREYAFFIEDDKEMAKRNGCELLSEAKMSQESTDRNQVTLLSLFEYMIGNTDWAVSVQHNIRVIKPKTDSLQRPYAVPYDFDYSGLVNTTYAVPDEKLGTQSVLERVYRGFPRTINELNDAFALFNLKKEKIYSLINSFEPLSPGNRKMMIGYLDDFYKTINNKNAAQTAFITNARTE